MKSKKVINDDEVNFSNRDDVEEQSKETTTLLPTRPSKLGQLLKLQARISPVFLAHCLNYHWRVKKMAL